MKMSFPEGIDLVVYINLDIRTDRRDEMEAELARVGVPKEKILRWSATRNRKNGALGCTMSHIAVLEYIQTLPVNIKSVLILEDDFNFIDNLGLVRDSLSKVHTLLPPDWDVVLLAYEMFRTKPFNDILSIALECYGTAGYLLNRSSLEKVLNNFREGREALIKSGHYKDSIDVYWWKLMKDHKFFYFNQALGYQRKSYSNVAEKIIQRNSFVM